MQRRPTPKQIAAARANGAKPRFPVTDAGKQASSRNSVKAGIYSRFLAVCSEQRAAYERLTAENMNQYGPRNPVETDFVNVDRQRQRIKAEFIEIEELARCANAFNKLAEAPGSPLSIATKPAYAVQAARCDRVGQSDAAPPASAQLAA